MVGDLYYGHEFTDLQFGSQTLNEFGRATSLYNEKHYDACIQTIWKLFELGLKGVFYVSGKKANVTDLILMAGKEGILTDCEVALTQALYRMRCASEHGLLSVREILVAKGLLVASIPLLHSLLCSRSVKSAGLEELRQLPDEEAVQAYLKTQPMATLLVLLEEVFEQLSLVHDYAQLSQLRNLLTAVKFAPFSRDIERDKLHLFDLAHRYLFSGGRSNVGIDHIYTAIRLMLDDLALKEHAVRYVDQYVHDLATAVDFHDAKARAQIIALFGNKLTSNQKKAIIKAIMESPDVRGSFGAQDALRPILRNMKDELDGDRLTILRENNFL